MFYFDISFDSILLNTYSYFLSDGPGCPQDEFRCASGECIPSSYTCDGERDCRDWTDESEDICQVTSMWDHFQCTNGKQVNMLL